MAFSESNLVWLDLEMTGLWPNTDKILEMAVVVTDSNLNVLAEGPVFAIHQSDEILDNMDEWCVNQHGKTGLTARCRASVVDLPEATAKTEEFLSQYISRGISPMCGNSIGQDRRFLAEHAPDFEAFFHYRNIDVSSIKELARRWKPDLLKTITKKGVHLALDDIRESIEELKVYREHFFKL